MINETLQDIKTRLFNYLITVDPFKTVYNAGNLSPSQVALFRAFLDTIATEIFTEEGLLNTFQNEIETTVASAPVRTAPWIQNQTLLFEYNTNTTPVASVNSDFTVGYPTPNPANRIISAAAIVVSGGGYINIKVATGSPFTPLSSLQLTALTAYLNTILEPSNFNIINYYSDLAQINAVIYYNGQYNAVIQTNVIAAIKAYYSSLPFNGTVKLSDIEKVILAVPGVTDVTFSQVTATPGTAVINVYGTPVNLVLASTILSRNYQTNSGSIIEDPSNTLASTLTFQIAQ